MVLKRFNVERVANDQATIDALKAQGFAPLEESKEEPAEPADYKSMSKSQLVRIAEQTGIDGAKNLKKDELVEVLDGGVPDAKEAESDGIDTGADSNGDE